MTAVTSPMASSWPAKSSNLLGLQKPLATTVSVVRSAIRSVCLAKCNLRIDAHPQLRCEWPRSWKSFGSIPHLHKPVSTGWVHVTVTSSVETYSGRSGRASVGCRCAGGVC